MAKVKSKKKDEESSEDLLPQFHGIEGLEMTQEELRELKREHDKLYGESKTGIPRHTPLWESEREPYSPTLLKPHGQEKRDKIVKTPRFATIDIETYKWINFVCGGIYFEERFSKNEKFVINDKLHGLMEQVIIISHYEDIKNFVAHFGGKFDFLFFLQAFIEMGEFSITNIIPRGSSILSFDVEPSPEYLAKLGIFEEFKKLTFRDSAALLPYGLAAITKSFNVPTKKGEMDFLFVKQVWEETDYLGELINHPSTTVFFSNKQITKLTRAAAQYKERIRYINSERFPWFAFRGKISMVKPYMLKVNKKGEVVKNDWLEAVSFPYFVKKDLVEYLKSDCKGLYQSVAAFFNAPLIRDARKSWTTASQAVNVFRLYMKSALHSLPDDDDYYVEGNVDEFVRHAYFGGRTEIFKPVFDAEILEKENLYYHDVNSLYPFVMAQNMYPDKFVKWVYGKEEYKKTRMAIWHCKVRVPEDMYVPPLPVKYEERLIFPVGEFEGYWTKHELEYAKSLGCEILAYYKGAAFQCAGYVFKDFINDLYSRRLKAKAEDDHVTQMTMKLLMNSCYGRMGINKMRSKIKFDDDAMINGVTIAEIVANEKNYHLIEVPEKAHSLFSNPAIACYVTSYARVHLHKQIMDVGPESVYYCDTDSVFTDRPMKTGKELGMMKLEYKCRSAVFLLPKTYLNLDINEEGKEKPIKTVMKGFDSKLVRNAFTREDFMEYLYGVRGHIAASERPRFATFKLALRQGTFVAMKGDPEINKRNDERREEEYLRKTGKKKRFIKKEYKIATKELKGEYSKREIIEDGFDTRPLVLKM